MNRKGTISTVTTHAYDSAQATAAIAEYRNQLVTHCLSYDMTYDEYIDYVDACGDILDLGALTKLEYIQVKQQFNRLRGLSRVGEIHINGYVRYGRANRHITI